MLWLGVAEGVEALSALAGAAEAAARAAGFPAESRPFAAHLTLSRLRAPADVRPLLAAVPPFPGRQRVERLVLYRSHLGPGGPRYQALREFELRVPS